MLGMPANGSGYHGWLRQVRTPGASFPGPLLTMEKQIKGVTGTSFMAVLGFELQALGAGIRRAIENQNDAGGSERGRTATPGTATPLFAGRMRFQPLTTAAHLGRPQPSPPTRNFRRQQMDSRTDDAEYPAAAGAIRKKNRKFRWLRRRSMRGHEGRNHIRLQTPAGRTKTLERRVIRRCSLWTLR